MPGLDSGKIAVLHVADGWGVGEGAGVGVGRLCCHSSEAMRASATAMTEDAAGGGLTESGTRFRGGEAEGGGGAEAG